MTRIAANAGDTPLILMCGKNAALAKALRATKALAPRIVVEFTPDVAYWMRLADFFIGKPGPCSLSEAVHMGLPVIITRNAWTMPQERWNTEWVTQNGLGVVHGSFRTVRAAIVELTNNLPQWQAQVRQMHNRAVFEIPDILANLQPLEQPPPCR
jgi:1,2-diacylglycerol 3-beta-galactosyltransferase